MISRNRIVIVAVVLSAPMFARLPQTIGADDGDNAAKPIPEKAVQLNDGFLKQRFDVVRTVTIPAAINGANRRGGSPISSARPQRLPAMRIVTAGCLPILTMMRMSTARLKLRRTA
jgi:hypothetical protein